MTAFLISVASSIVLASVLVALLIAERRSVRRYAAREAGLMVTALELRADLEEARGVARSLIDGDQIREVEP